MSRVYQARRKDPSLTFKQAAKELGISESSLFKMRKGTRTGQGSIRSRVISRPTLGSEAKGTLKKQSVKNSFTVTFQSADGSRVASRNINMTGASTKADALLMRHDPTIKKAVQRHLAKEEQQQDRYQTGSPLWKRKQRQGLQVTSVTRTVRAQRPSYLLQYKSERDEFA